MQNRVFFSDNGTLIDFSTELDSYFAGTKTMPFIAAQDALYIGQKYPFNHFHLKLSVVNTNAANMTVALWDGANFNAVAELIDETKLGAATLGQSGFVSWVPDREKTWEKEDTSDGNGNQNVNGLGSVRLYDYYWAKITFSADLLVGTTLAWIGQIFSDDNDLAVEFPDLVKTNTMTAFKAGKTNWEEQHALAAKIIIDDLKKQGVLDSPSRILERRELTRVSVMKVAEIAFSAFGDDFLDQRLEARKEYDNRLKKDIYLVDRNNNGRIDAAELSLRQGNLSR